ncbi:response regulator [Capillimicrobium parvum]|uniref:Protein-glutamate methylesterase/protein-glutamine glutaminase n=1 Tax=Capillimicrobium parvum TaxID=2884022 RepID=A0A9E7C2P3_9ACTN|nr:response regulator transcription factor [Capillimicrobium parvum]UGS38656.1 Protein-glutamate methylesterase/protein-glutamine glutaminase [Capillimicrobium parvum]
MVPKCRGRAAGAVTVLTVDDQDVFRTALRELIAATPGFEQAGEAASGAEAIERAAELEPDVVLLDVRMPGMDGIETARRLNRLARPPLVVLISLDPTAAPTTECGAATFVTKQELSTARLHAIWTAHDGGGRPS